MDKADGRKVKSECSKGCGRKFNPAGRAYHEKFCTGPGYLPGHTHSVEGRHDVKKEKLECQYCHKPIGRQGIGPHEKFCEERPDHMVVRQKHRELFRQAKVERVETVEANEESMNVEIAYALFHDDAAMFGVVTHLLTAKSGLDVIANLKAAKTLIDLKIKNLGG